uniref:AAA domain-containing protein n=1 Tax=Angiostrongylus cantonensis TaxID=6313 RepID=A0A0K0DIM7_ANGCA
MLREELQQLNEQASYIYPEGKYVVDVEKGVDVQSISADCRVALRPDSYVLHKVLPNKVIELPVKHPELFEALGIAQPKGVLLYGPPGTGKTLLARAVAHHTECTFIRVSGSELVQKFIGEGARMVIMATNRIDILDPALLRPGRIDRKIEFPAPDEKARAEILKIHSRKMNLVRGINMKKVAEAIAGASGAEVKALCTEAGMFALRERRAHVTQEDFEMAVGKVMQNDAENNMSLKKLWK